MTSFDDGPAVEQHPAVLAARRLATDLLAPRAATVDASVVPRSHLEAIAAAGLFGVAAPVAAGGLEVPAPVARRVVEELAGADLATWFVQEQHHSLVRLLTGTGRRPELLAELAAGRTVAGVAFSHLRRWPQRPVEAARDGGGWRLDGTAPWYTGWGLNDVALVAGVTGDGEAVFGVVPAREQPGLQASAPMDVAALACAVTVTLRLDGLRLGPDDVLQVLPIEAWAAVDARASVNVRPAVFGVARSALDLLGELAERRGEPQAADAAVRLGARLSRVRAECYALMDDGHPDERTRDRLDLRAQAHQVMVEATSALVIAGAGASMARSDPAQRKAREALFLLVQGQTRAARAAALDAAGADRVSGRNR